MTICVAVFADQVHDELRMNRELVLDCLNKLRCSVVHNVPLVCLKIDLLKPSIAILLGAHIDESGLIVN